MVGRRAVETGGVEGDDRDLRLARRRGRQQVGHVDAALEHDHVTAVGEERECGGLPVGTGREDEGDHGAAGGHAAQLPSTVTTGASRSASSANHRSASSCSTASTSWRVPVRSSTDGASTTVTPSSAGPAHSGQRPVPRT